MSVNEADAKLAHNIVSQSLDPVLEYQTKMGIVNFHYAYDHYFEATNYLMMLIDEFNTWLEEDVAPLHLPEDNRYGFKIPDELPHDDVIKMKQIWWGGDPARNINPVYLYQKRNTRKEIIAQRIIYELPQRISNYESVWQMPALKHLNPKSRTKDDTDQRVLLQESVPVDLAWSGVSPQQLADIVRFKDVYPEGEEPIYKSDEEILWSDDKTLEVGREFYHKIIRIELLEFYEPKRRVWNTMKRCLRSFKYCMHLRRIQLDGGDDMADSDYVTEYVR